MARLLPRNGRAQHAPRARLVNEPGGDFLWLRKAKAGCSLSRSAADRDEFVGWHDGYSRLADPVIHRRRILLEKRPRRIEITDRLSMKGAHLVEIFFHCSELCEVKPRGQAVDLLHASLPYPVRITLPQAPDAEIEIRRGDDAPICGWRSHAYDEKVPASTLVCAHACRATPSSSARSRANPHGSTGVAAGPDVFRRRQLIVLGSDVTALAVVRDAYHLGVSSVVVDNRPASRPLAVRARESLPRCGYPIWCREFAPWPNGPRARCSRRATSGCEQSSRIEKSCARTGWTSCTRTTRASRFAWTNVASRLGARTLGCPHRARTQ